jgi:hypothetical protein
MMSRNAPRFHNLASQKRVSKTNRVHESRRTPCRQRRDMALTTVRSILCAGVTKALTIAIVNADLVRHGRGR